MLAIRLNRTGKNKRASFRLAVQEHTVAPGGRHVEVVGSYDPHTKQAVLKAERIKYWISKGAQVSDSVFNLLVREHVIEGKKREKKIKKAVVEAPAEAPEGAAAVAEQPAEGGAAAQEAPAAEKAEEPKKDESKPEETK